MKQILYLFDICISVKQRPVKYEANVVFVPYFGVFYMSSDNDIETN